MPEMGDRKLIGMWAGDNWKLRGYAWRSPCVRSPMSGQNMRAIVAMDERGKYHQGWEKGGGAGKKENARGDGEKSRADAKPSCGTRKSRMRLEWIARKGSARRLARYRLSNRQWAVRRRGASIFA